ncbi:hypothetical protein FBU59_004306, partial [Linderina macrospora]
MASLSIPFLKTLGSKYRVILASGSPRRRELLDRLDIHYEVIPSQFAEDLDKSQFASASDYVLENAVCKAHDVYQSTAASDKPMLVIGSDTVVVSAEGAILEKPASTANAVETLKGLSGKTNTVFTGVCLLIQVPGEEEPRVERAIESTTVTFGDLDDDLVQAYVDTGEPMDKAGSYAYQSLA